ncbi:MAG: cytochrome c biogenesis protein CcsA [Planctomycetota bacterium]|nr:cytochrome c biogenesis protein CcsA [Planctomycetota bacterium]
MTALLQWLVPLVYLLGATLYFSDFWSGARRWDRVARGVFWAGLLVHAGRLTMEVFRLDALPLGGIFPFLTLLSFSVVAVMLFLEMGSSDGSTAVFLAWLAVGLEGCSAVGGPFPQHAVSTAAHPAVFGIHVGTAILGYAGAAVAAIHGVLYLLLYREIKSNRVGRIYRFLPPLDQIEKRTGSSVALSFVALTVSLVFGMRVLRVTESTYWLWDAKILTTCLVWVLFGLTLSSRRWLGWSGRRVAFFSLFGFLLALASLGFVGPFLSGFHTFSGGGQ